MSAPPPEHTADSRRTVLLVEDDEITREFLQAALDGSFMVDVAKTTAQALETVRQSTLIYDVFLLDISLRPGPGGVALLSALREMEVYRLTPAIAITAYHPDAAPEDFMAAGFDGYLRKPFYQQELVALIEELLTPNGE